jgi:hypothetical protein
MRIANFRDDVLWALAQRLGLDPTKQLLPDQAAALTLYVNAWMRRTCDAQDWPELTQITAFTVPPNHTFPYDYTFITNGQLTVSMGKVLKVYLLDPRTTPFNPIDTPFRLLNTGVHVGFEHGPTVFIKYMLRPPVFTSVPWDSARIYNKGDLTYSPVSGQCYKSKTSNNVGNDPSGAPPQGPPPPVLPVPTLVPIGGNVPLTVTITTRSDLQIIYTLDGTPPAVGNGTLVATPAAVLITDPATLRAVSTNGTDISDEISGRYGGAGGVPIPTFAPPGGSYRLFPLGATISAATGLTIIYTLDGSDPTINPDHGTPIPSNRGGVIIHTAPATLKAIAVAADHMSASDIVSATYTQSITTQSEFAIPVSATLIQPAGPPNPGVDARNKVMTIGLTGTKPGPDPPATPVAGSAWQIIVADATGATLATATHTATGSETLAAILTNLQSQLAAALTAFVSVTADTTAFTITLEDDSDFYITSSAWSAVVDTNGHATFPASKLLVQQVKGYLPAVAPSGGTNQVFAITLSDEQTVYQALYTITLVDPTGHQHTVSYQSVATDSATQILAELSDQIQGSIDPYFMGVFPALDTNTSTLTLETIEQVAVDVNMVLTTNQYWDLVQFPYVLIDPIVRGAYSDALKEEGQTDKGSTEEKAVPEEVGLRAAAQTGSQYDSLTDQQKPHSRYSVK